MPSWAHTVLPVLLLTPPRTVLCGKSLFYCQGLLLIVNRYCLTTIRTRRPPCSVSRQTMKTFADVFPAPTGLPTHKSWLRNVLPASKHRPPYPRLTIKLQWLLEGADCSCECFRAADRQIPPYKWPCNKLIHWLYGWSCPPWLFISRCFSGTSLVIQWIRSHLPMQGTWAQSLGHPCAATTEACAPRGWA